VNHHGSLNVCSAWGGVDISEAAEEARFWDTHDSTDFLGAFRPAKLTFPKRKPKVLVSVRLGTSEVALMRQIAARKGLGYGSLLRMWLTERLLEEVPAQQK